MMKLKKALILGILVGTAACSGKPQNIQMRNQTCPVSGQPVNDQDTYVYKGKEYKLCSDQCKQSLSDDPGKYLSD